MRGIGFAGASSSSAWPKQLDIIHLAAGVGGAWVDPNLFFVGRKIEK